jgi:hypothetical protein
MRIMDYMGSDSAAVHDDSATLDPAFPSSRIGTTGRLQGSRAFIPYYRREWRKDLQQLYCFFSFIFCAGYIHSFNSGILSKVKLPSGSEYFVARQICAPSARK